MLVLLSLFVITLGNPAEISMEVRVIKANKKEIDIKTIKTYSRVEIIRAIIRQESSDGRFLYSSAKWEKAVGVLQIRPVMVDEVNRIVGFNAFILDDRLDSLKSVYMFVIFQREHNPTLDFETASRMWNGGDRGMRKTATIKYFNSVKDHMDDILASNNKNYGNIRTTINSTQ